MGFFPLTSSTDVSLVGEVQAGLLNRTDLSAQRCVGALNIAQVELSRKHDFKEMKQFFSTSTFSTDSPYNDKFIPLAPYCKHLHTVVLQDNTLSRKLVEKPWRQFDAMWPSPESLARSRCCYYSRWNQSIIVYPVPDNVYPIFMRVTVYPRPFSLTAAPNAVSDYEFKDDILIKVAQAYLWGSFGRPDKKDDLLAEVFAPGGMFDAAMKQDTDMPDMEINVDLGSGTNLGEYWADPFIRTQP